MTAAFAVDMSALDEARFGIRTVKASAVTAATVPALLEFCRAHGARFAIARCSVHEPAAVQSLERAGFELMDTHVQYRCDLTRVAIPDDVPALPLRLAGAKDVDAVAAVAAAAFHDYHGHYHADPRLDRRQCDEVYIDWARRACADRSIAERVMVAERDGRIVAFTAYRLNGPDEGEGFLIAVAPEARRLGLSRSLVVDGMRWCQARGARYLRESTHLTNLAVQRVWTRLGLGLDRAEYTLHRWFDVP